MKVIILAGGLGTRLAEYTDAIPKPMVPIGGKPILWHIMERYAIFGHKDFVLALGYKADVIKNYFLNYKTLTDDFSVDLGSGELNPLGSAVDAVDWNVSLVNTGEGTMTGGRLKRLRRIIGEEPFMLTYGDGLCDINIPELLQFHYDHKKMITVTAVRPQARFGELEIRDGLVTSFEEKPQLHQGWINGGFFVVEPEFLSLIDDDSTYLEREPLERAAAMGEFMAYQHSGFWQCMDTKRDQQLLEKLWYEDPPWRGSRI